MTCPKCGKENNSNTYCVYCGFRFGSSVAKYVEFDNKVAKKDSVEKISQTGLIPLMIFTVNLLLVPILVKFFHKYLFKISFFDIISENLHLANTYIPFGLVMIYLLISVIGFIKSFKAYYDRGITLLRKVALIIIFVVVLSEVALYVGPFVWDYITKYKFM